MSHYVDVHTHLTHPDFSNDYQEVIQKSKQAGLAAIVVNGLEPKSNRQILEMAEEYDIIKAALGIYPIDAVHDSLPTGFPIKVESFSLKEEIRFIDEMGSKAKLSAIGECGLDGHWLDSSSFKKQEEVFISLIEIAHKYDLPIIVHSRKCERRVLEILAYYKCSKVNLHCWGGKAKLVKTACAEQGWYLSIPPIAKRNPGFQNLMKIIPLESLLTETDAPYLGPERNTRNEPINVIGTVKLLAEIKGISVDDARSAIWKNYCKLFSY
jgi:TatD DNase family protein